jgi:hypothetical protein
MSKPCVTVCAAIGMLGIACVGPICGSASAGGERASRYSMSPAEGGGFVRLDAETGQMALCQRHGGDWSCRELAEPDRGLASEIERLRDENKRLKGEIRQMEDILLSDKRVGQDGKAQEFKLPTEQDLDQALSYAQRMLRKFREKMKELETDNRATPL